MKTLRPLLLVLTFMLFIPLTTQAQNPRTSGAATTASPSLKEKVAATGWVKVIVDLNMGFQAEGDLAPAAAADQQTRIKKAQDNVLKQFSSSNMIVNQRFDYVPGLAVSVTAEGLAQLEAMPEVNSVVEDGMNKLLLSDTTSIIGANRAWYGGGFTGAGWTVAVLDTGVDSGHPFLSGKVVSEACYSTPSLPGVPSGVVQSLCPNGQASQTGTGAARNCNDTEGCEHGTHVAGIVAGKNNKFSGVAPDANLIAIQVFTKINSEGDCGGVAHCISSFDSNVISALERVYSLRNNFKIAAVNMSLGSGLYQDPCDTKNRLTKAAIDNLRSVGIATVIASGNDGYYDSIAFPACISTAVSVGATNDDDAITNFSDTAYFLNLLAPGDQIESSVPGGGYESLDGTSMAAPHVAGAWAIRKQVSSGATVSDILNYFKRTGEPVYDSYTKLYYPRIQVDQEMPLADMDLTVSFDKVEAALGDKVVVTFQIKNTGAYPLKLNSIFSGLTFSPNPLPVGQTATTKVQHTIVMADLPGPYQLGDLVEGTYNNLSAVDFASSKADLVAILVEGNVNDKIAEEGGEVYYYYKVTNIGKVNVTLTGSAKQFGSPQFDNNILAYGETTNAQGYHTVTKADLPGPLTNDTTMIGTSAKGTAAKVVISGLSTDLIELINVDPRATTSQIINTAQNVTTLEFPPASLSTFATQVVYLKTNRYPRLPAIYAGLVFDSAFKTNTSTMIEAEAPFTVTIRYQDNLLPTAVPEKELVVYHYNYETEQWGKMPRLITNTVANTVVFTNTELGLYALTGHAYTNFFYLPVITR